MSDFFAIMGRFPRGEGFILRGKEALFLREEAVAVDVTNKTVIGAERAVPVPGTLVVHTRADGPGTHLRVVGRRHIPGVLDRRHIPGWGTLSPGPLSYKTNSETGLRGGFREPLSDINNSLERPSGASSRH